MLFLRDRVTNNMSNVKDRLSELHQKIVKELDVCMKFWLTHSHDEEYGGFFSCLSQTGKCYDDIKYIWLQGRQVWMYCKLYLEVERYRNNDVLQAAIKGADFLMKYAKTDTGKCYFAVTRKGQPVKMQRTIFSECFYTLALAEIAKATENKIYLTEALKMMQKIKHWVTVDDSELGVLKLEGSKNIEGLAVPMMMLHLVDELETLPKSLNELKFTELADWSVKKILRHAEADSKIVHESILSSGQKAPGAHGRLVNPGHVIECGWFLLRRALKTNDTSLKDIAINRYMLQAFDFGWDRKYGGLYYFLDSEGYCPTQLEWNMKLWWPHNEALIAFLMAYQTTRDDNLLAKFQQVFDYSFKHFSDSQNGEWFGYLKENGEINQTIKGGPFKGCYHVPRSLMLCEQMLQNMMSDG